jgi:hypothetical protein
VSRANLNLQLKRFHDAMQDANAALKISHELGLKQDQFRAHQIAAFASFSLNDRSLAESELKKASQVLEQMERNLSETNLRHFESKPEVVNFENRMQKFLQDQTL